METTTPQRASIGTLRNASAGNLAAAPKKPSLQEINALPQAKRFPVMLEAFKSEIAVALPSHLNADRMARIALTCFRQNPKLAECEPQSVFAAIVVASQLGLEPGLLGQAYLIPFRKKVKGENGRADRWVMECQLMPGYQGLVDLARRSGRIKSLEAHVVYEKDEFECSFGIEPVLSHRPNWDGDRGAMRLAYAVAHLADGGVHVEVMARREIHRIRDRSQNVQNAKKYDSTTPWDTDEEQMWIKTVLRRICKFLPKSVELASALALEAAAARGSSQQIDLSSVIEGDFEHIGQIEHDTDEAGDDAGENGATATASDSGAAGADPSPDANPATATAAPESPTKPARGARGASQPLV